MSSGDQYFFGFVHTDPRYVLPLAWSSQRPSASPYSSSTLCRNFNLVCLFGRIYDRAGFLDQ
ncbi:MAG: hypothetical protein DWQ53_24470 [Microcystis flos-aquae DF17]|uniref:Uncharacterized protein n=1 Tax=Microcystis aeruginosa (strain NIES-843 / IAM M-2473) TaxID=449447 RepID=B0JG16_MICAN|nr:MAG: hypothetical protein DWQ53_24470 [Microcystis flos-aquae DF17]BAG02021.1 unknown protein [Microcystis aeruginosa NIES-843]